MTVYGSRAQATHEWTTKTKIKTIIERIGCVCVCVCVWIFLQKNRFDVEVVASGYAWVSSTSSSAAVMMCAFHFISANKQEIPDNYDAAPCANHTQPSSLALRKREREEHTPIRLLSIKYWIGLASIVREIWLYEINIVYTSECWFVDGAFIYTFINWWSQLAEIENMADKPGALIWSSDKLTTCRLHSFSD